MKLGVGIVSGMIVMVFAGCADRGISRITLRAGEEPCGPWWMRETAMGPNGKLDLHNKPWWPRATQLKVGESFLLDAEGRPQSMLVRRERIRNRSTMVDAIVWIIDDDEDDSVCTGGDQDSDCYVVDYGADGLVDRIVDFIDDDGDNGADEMDIRYFENGELRSVWCGLDLDGDHKMWDLQGYEYSGNFFKSDPYGNNMIYMNKFDPVHGEWAPISECPFAFFDTDGDGYSEIAVRVSAAPLAYDTGSDPDYANDSRRYRGPWTEEMNRMGAMNVRYSFDIDNLSGPKTPLHYDCGFNMIGATPYQFAGMRHINTKRRPPQVTQVIPFDRLRNVCDTYAARETGFSWHEQHDDTISIGDPGTPELKNLDYRWEGVFWNWERRLMPNTGGPGQKWNVRREWSDTPTNRRELYYSEVDRRIHLYGAKEGWIQVGHFGGEGALGEIRMFDTDNDGYFDRWEVYAMNEPVPVRVSTVHDPRARRMPFDYAELGKFYTEEVLPNAMAANERVLAAMQPLRSFEAAPGLKSAITTGSPTERRYAQDIVREMYYLDIRRRYGAEAHRILSEAKMDDLRGLSPEQRAHTKTSAWAWRVLTSLEKLDVAYGQGDIDATCATLNELSAVVASATQ